MVWEGGTEGGMGGPQNVHLSIIHLSMYIHIEKDGLLQPVYQFKSFISENYTLGKFTDVRMHQSKIFLA